MSFQIKNYSFANKNITLSNEKEPSENSHTFTILTGKNGVGKSRLLVSLVSNHLSNSSSNLKKVIAVSNIKNDKFPIQKGKFNNYFYIGNNSNVNSYTNDRFFLFSNLISNTFLNYNSVNYTFEYLGFNSCITLDFQKIKTTLNEKNFILKYLEIYDTYYHLFNPNGIYSNHLGKFKEAFNICYEIRNKKIIHSKNHYNNLNRNTLGLDSIEYSLDKNEENYESFDAKNTNYYFDPVNFFDISEIYFIDSLFKMHAQNKKIDTEFFIKLYNLLFSSDILKNTKNICFDLSQPSRSQEQKDLIFLLKYNIIKITNVNLFKQTSLQKVKFFDLSSGQQSLFNIFLGISGVIEDNSLICIDEPEINLHPEWQNQFIVKLQEIFNHINNCHFIIATHSPQIVAGLTSKNGYVVDLEKNITYTANDYSKKSSDFQLAHIFGYPGHNNEYLIRVALTILSKISKNIKLNENDQLNLSLLNQSINNLPKNDPVLLIIEQINSLMD
ncbi:ATP-binding protein [Acinetobacter sp. ANC 5033]|uniref:AAA family ATPase n=1 Tax=Acinetobacter amyesii TaxID=2942470 RepID=UPI00201B77E5|nr:AAA family ATPase [Acinetobacter amyesii]MCL6236987.1 ATP-binding protein [Acinetobacter amyesii]